MKTDIFTYLKTTVEETLKPQKQITIRATRAALEKSDGNLPGDALIKPIGAGGSMAIFGLSMPNRSLGKGSYRRSRRVATVILGARQLLA
jgi:hypothetical protein